MPLKIPALLRTLIETGRWQHPGDDVLRQRIPRLADPVDFRNWVPQNTVADEIASFSPRDRETFKLYRDTDDLHRPLPWLNADKAVFIAVNRVPGDDVAIALDYRDSADEPTVVASCWPEDKFHEWFKVADSFDEFAQSLAAIIA
jgi:hypothetical protein